ncbi:FtsK/SpoIIIE domain-containing protein [Nocardioides sp. NPDC087217]|uniref:FtsK/SpoIIIE domain-containing protein n=1 Tax=Nocardioides sp. NPDC087217 TaxID=3364335 RepID=UPI003811BE3E
MSTNLNESDQADEVYDLEAARRARESRAADPTADSDSDPISVSKPAHAAEESAQDASENTAAAEATEDEDVPVLVEGEVLAVRDDSATVAQRASAPRREVLPGWAKNRDAAKAAAKWATSYYSHLVAYHTVRLPLYYGKLSARSPLGAGRLVATTWGWINDAADRENRMAVRGSTLDAGAFLQLKEHHRRQVQARTFMVLVAVLVLAGLIAGVLFGTNPMVQLVVALAALGGLGILGRNPDKPITGRAVDATKEPRLTSDLIVDALGSLGLGELNKALTKYGSKAIAFVSPIMRDGAGWRAEIDLPGGVTASEIIDRRDRLASGLRRSLGKVWPEADTDVHAGRLVLYVADKSLSETEPAAWALESKGKVNIFDPIPIGQDQRGRPIHATLMFALVLIGAIPRIGKTFLQRLLVLAAALDPRVKLYIFDLKGGADWLPLRHVAHALRIGDDPEDIAYVLASLRSLRTEMQRRYKLLRRLPLERCPESKVTDELASDKSLDLGPILVALDECGLAFGHSEHGKEITDICVDLGKRGPAAGIILMPATQRIDAASVPPGISSNAALRFALKVMDHTANDMILGSGMYKAGVRATMFGRHDRGVTLMVGEADDPVIFRSAKIDAEKAEKIALRARAARHAAGLLTGLAAGEEDAADTDTGSILDHLLAVWPANDPEWSAGKVWCEELAHRLAAAQPSLYEGWTGEQITAAVKPHGIRTVQIKRNDPEEGKPVNKRGLVRRDLTDTLGHTDPDQNPNTGLSTGPNTGPASPSAGTSGGPLEP